MIQNCQQFEERIQELMDQRIDPETDELICAHMKFCETCHESLMAFSVLHTTYLNDSDSMKIKLENLGLHEVLTKRKQQKPERGNFIAILASVAAAVLLLVALNGSDFWRGTKTAPVAVVIPSNSSAKHSPVSLNSFLQVKRSLDQNEIYGSLRELPGICPFKALSTYLDWLHKSWDEYSDQQATPELGHSIEMNCDQHYSINMSIAARI